MRLKWCNCIVLLVTKFQQELCFETKDPWWQSFSDQTSCYFHITIVRNGTTYNHFCTSTLNPYLQSLERERQVIGYRPICIILSKAQFCGWREEMHGLMVLSSIICMHDLSMIIVDTLNLRKTTLFLGRRFCKVSRHVSIYSIPKYSLYCYKRCFEYDLALEPQCGQPLQEIHVLW